MTNFVGQATFNLLISAFNLISPPANGLILLMQ